MKKTLEFFSMVVAIVMSLSMLASAISLDALIKPITSYEAKGTFYTALDKPMELLSHPDFVKAMNEEMAPFGIDVDLLVKSLFDSKMDYEVKMNMSPDFKNADLYANFAYHVPAELDDKFRIETDTSFEMWMSYDFSDIENPRMKMIFDYPLASEYIVMDLTDFPQEVREQEVFKNGMKAVDTLLTEENLAEYNKSALDLIVKHATVEKRINKIELKFDNASFAKLAGDVFSFALDMAAEMYGDSAEDVAHMKTFVPEFLSSAKLLGENGIRYECIFNQVGILKGERLAMDIDFNLYNILTGLGLPAEYLGIVTAENSSLAFTAYAEVDYSRVNGDVQVDFPALTEENTFSLVKDLMPAPIPESTPAVEEVEFNNIVVFSNDYMMESGVLYIPYNALLDENNLSTDNTAIFEQLEAQVKAGADRFIIEKGEVKAEITLQHPMVEKDGSLYVATDFVTDVFGQKIDSFSYSTYFGITIIYNEPIAG